jgi:hypothetical protein
MCAVTGLTEVTEAPLWRNVRVTRGVGKGERGRPEARVLSPLISIYHFKITCAHGRQNSARLEAAQVIQYSHRDLNCHVSLQYSSHISGSQVNIFEHNDCRTACWLEFELSEQVFFKSSLLFLFRFLSVLLGVSLHSVSACLPSLHDHTLSVHLESVLYKTQISQKTLRHSLTLNFNLKHICNIHFLIQFLF